MAKFSQLLGTAHGRVGGLVFSKGEKGMNYVRSYQPQVANPKSVAQKSQRAKMNLVGRLSQVTPAEVLAGLSGATPRGRRSRFNSLLLQACTLDTSDPSAMVALIEPEDVVFSEGGALVCSTFGSPMVVTARDVTIGLTLTDASLAGRYGEKIIIAVIDPSQKAGYSLVVARDIVFENTTEKRVVVPIAPGIAKDSLVCFYRAPFILSDDGKATIHSSTIYNDGSQILAELLSGGSAVREWGQSLLSDTLVFTPA